MAIDYTQSEVQVLIDLIRTDNGRKPLTASQFTFGNPIVFNPIPAVNRNTALVATAIPGRGYKNSATFYYNRVPLPKFVPPNQEDILSFTAGAYRTLSELLPELNERLSINLTPEMVYDAVLPTFAPFDGFDVKEIALRVRPNSLVYLESLTLKIERVVIDLAEAIPDPDMNGLVYAAPTT